jgi:hypothetical protein
VVQSSVKEFLAGETPREQAVFCNSYHGCCGPKKGVSLLDTGTTGQPLSDGLTNPRRGRFHVGGNSILELSWEYQASSGPLLDAPHESTTLSNV